MKLEELPLEIRRRARLSHVRAGNQQTPGVERMKLSNKAILMASADWTLALVIMYLPSNVASAMESGIELTLKLTPRLTIEARRLYMQSTATPQMQCQASGRSWKAPASAGTPRHVSQAH